MKILAVFIKLASSSIIVYLSLSEKLIHNYAVHMIVTFPWCALINNHTLIISSLSKCRLLNQIIHTCVNVSIILLLKDNMNLIWGFLSPSQAGTLWNFSPSLDPDSSSYDPGCVLQVSTHLLLYLKKKVKMYNFICAYDQTIPYSCIPWKKFQIKHMLSCLQKLYNWKKV